MIANTGISMRLGIHEAIPLILAIPAHRSPNSMSKELGEKAVDLLFTYKEIASDDTEKAYNIAMIGSVLSCLRAFAVERTRMNSIWKSIEAIKERRARLLSIFRNISPLAKGNYWAKSLLVLMSLGIASKDFVGNFKQLPSAAIIALIIGVIIAEVISKIGEFSFAFWFERKMPIEKFEKWGDESLIKYKKFVNKFIDEAINVHKRYYPTEENISIYDISSNGGIEKLKKDLINRHFYWE